MLNGKWILNSRFDGTWKVCKYFDTKEEAISYGKTILEKYNHSDEKEKVKNSLEDGLNMFPETYENISEFFVGQIEKAKFPDLTDWLLETIADSVYDEFGESSEGYLDCVTVEHKKELGCLIEDWATRHNYLPTCFTIINTEQVWINS